MRSSLISILCCGPRYSRSKAPLLVWPSETTNVVWKCSQPFSLTEVKSQDSTPSGIQHETTFPPDVREPVEITLTVKTGGDAEFELATHWTTNEDRSSVIFPTAFLFCALFVPTDKPSTKKTERPELAGRQLGSRPGTF